MSLLPPALPLDLTEEEKLCGFALTEESSGMRAVVRELPAGLRAVKVQAADGGVEYAVCDQQLQPLYAPAKTLVELRKRFGRPPP